MKKIGIVMCLMLTALVQLNAQQNKAKASLNHTAIYVVDLAASGNFYSNIIGLDTVAEPFHDGKHIWYKTAEHTMLHVIQGATQKKEYFKNQHTCFTVTNINDFVNKLNQLKWSYEDKEGKKQSITNRIDGVHQLWIQDPDGYWIEINDDKF
jgi:lactoylglutathione lyase